MQSMKIVELIPEWAEAHEVKHDAIVNQIYIAHAWCNSNPKKAPKKNPVRFLWSWMAAAKRYGNLKSPVPATAKQPEVIPPEDMSFEEMVAIRKMNMRTVKPIQLEIVEDEKNVA